LNQANPGLSLRKFLIQVYLIEEASQGAGWIKELNEEHIPETEEYGISSFVYRRKRPFHPERWRKWLEYWPEEIVRAKGFFWLATRNDIAGLLSQAGPSIMLQAAGNWVAAYPDSEINQILSEDPEQKAKWDSEFGDRMTELVMIGVGMDIEEIAASLDECLLTEEEMSMNWSDFSDPLPPFTEPLESTV
jgi:G3E family GTPase